jgi:hypothetical protein
VLAYTLRNANRPLVLRGYLFVPGYRSLAGRGYRTMGSVPSSAITPASCVSARPKAAAEVGTIHRNMAFDRKDYGMNSGIPLGLPTVWR